jgi:hypothetical protein
MHWKWVPAWLCALVVGSAQTPEIAPELLTLSRIKTVMTRTLSRQPNYTCVQQIERSNRKLPKRTFQLHDLLRIEVALVDGHEMYAWPGSKRFDETDLTLMVSDGAIGTGNFATHARAVFESSAPRFTFVGASQARGRSATRYDYVVPLISSGYRIKCSGREAIVGYHGSFWADPATNELLRLEVNADAIPPELGVSEARDIMDYDRVKIGDSEFLLPVASELSLVDLLGNENRNRTQFTACRQYSGESVLRFDAPPATEPVEEVAAKPATAKPASKVRVEVPADLVFDIRLETEIDSARSAVGDPVTATLEQNIKSERRILFRKGATLVGRILRLERHGDSTVMDLQFSELESDESRATLVARVDESTSATSSLAWQSFRAPPEAQRDRRGGLHIRGTHLHLHPGARLRLRTHSASQ